MRPAKSINSLTSQQQAAYINDRRPLEPPLPPPPPPTQTSSNQNANNSNNNSPTSPICRCRVMYLGSSVPHITKDGLQGIQEPLRELYPDKATLASGNAGIDSWLSVWSNGILIENVDETGREVKRFFKIDALHYCAAVKYIPTPKISTTTATYSNNQSLPKFLPLDSPHARHSDSNPPVFASILRRTTGIKVLECHAFICKREAAANALVRCCFHAYADTMYAKQIGADINGISNDVNNNSSSQVLQESNNNSMKQQYLTNGDQPIASRRSKSIAALNEADNSQNHLMENWSSNNQTRENYSKANSINMRQEEQQRNLMLRRKSMNENYAQNCDIQAENHHQQQHQSEQLKKQQKLSKSMHHLNGQQLYPTNFNHPNLRDQVNDDYDQSTSASCINIPSNRWQQQNMIAQQHLQVPPHPQPFYEPYAGRVPSYPPQNLIDNANNSGTLKSIRSMAANSIASTLLRSKKHAKAMSMAQLNQDKITSFHQPHSKATTMVGPMMMPPIPPMFLPNIPHHTIINGSQTMKAPSSRQILPFAPGPPMNFEAMTPKEMKKLLKKSAKYGIDPSKFGENGLPLMPLHLPPPLMSQSCHMPQPHSKSGTMISQSMVSEIYGSDMPDLASIHGIPPPPLPLQRGGPMDHLDMHHQQMKPILVKPNPEFLKSKAGKKWLKQQKEFKKLLPPHLDGLPIIFGPPPMDAMKPALIPNHGLQPPQPPNFMPPIPPQGLPMMDSSGYYNPHPFYGQNGRASAASTLVRYSPHGRLIHDDSMAINGFHHDGGGDYRNHVMFNNGGGGLMGPPPPVMQRPSKDYISDNSSIIYGNNECSSDAHIKNEASRHQLQRRNGHMVEQSIISLGDENDYDDEEDDAQRDYYVGDDGMNHHQEPDSYSRRSKTSQSNQRINEHINTDYQDKRNFNSQDHYDQVATNVANSVDDDQGSYSSGLYKRGHINERAFSYSIRQEHKLGNGSGTNSDIEYSTRNEISSDNDNQLNQECRMNHENNQHGNIYQNKSNVDYYMDNNNVSQTIPVNELTARLENQLNMKSFSNSRVKSHM